MRSRILCAFVLALALAAPAAARADGPASVHLKECTTGSDPSQRSATYQAWMRSVPGSVRMALRFRLIARYPGHRPQAVGSSKLSKWHRSHSGVTRYGYKQTVKELAAAGSYRAVVRFRWYDADHNVIRRAKRVSEACVQKGELPNLVITGVHIAPGMACTGCHSRTRVRATPRTSPSRCSSTARSRTRAGSRGSTPVSTRPWT